MKTKIIVATLAVVTVLALAVRPTEGANQDIIQLQVQVQALQDQMLRMQQTFDERMGVMRNLVEHNSDSVNKATAAINELNANLQRQQGDSSGKVDQVSGQVQALNDTMDEVKARLAERYAEGGDAAPAAPLESPPPGQTALFNSWEDAVECAKCGGRMIRTGSCYTCRDCGTNTGCS